MSSHDNEPLDVPSIVPERDEDRPVGRRRPTPEAAPTTASRGGATLLWVLLGLALAGWSGWQQWLLLQSEQQLASYESRVAELEQRLSVTDENVSESSVAMQVKLKELDSEIRKLWDNVWKRASRQLEEHDQRLGALDKTLEGARTSLTRAEKTLEEQQKTLTALGRQLDKSSGLDATVELNKRQLQEQKIVVETLTGQVRELRELSSRLEQRVVANEEWVQSINAFRRQVNRDLLTLKEGGS